MFCRSFHSRKPQLMDFIDTQISAYPALADEYRELGDLYSRKLWHQLSGKLSDFLAKTGSNVGNNWQLLYREFIKSFEARLSQVRLASLVSTIGQAIEDPVQSLALFEEVLMSKERLGQEATLCLEMDIVLAHLRLNQIKEAKALLDGGKEQLSSFTSSEALVFSKFYKSCAEYRKIVGPPQDFYKAGLMFLTYTGIEDLSPAEASRLATDMALASVTGDDIYNFGEVLATPILGCLKGTANEWLQDLVLALHHGSVVEFNAVVDRNRTQYFALPALANKHEDVKKKVVLLALVNIAFSRSSNDREIKFADIADMTYVPIKEVEWVLMRAMSVNLLKGTIDQVDQSVNITWVQPRVLDKPQLEVISGQLHGWAERVKDTLLMVEDQTAELLY